MDRCLESSIRTMFNQTRHEEKKSWKLFRRVSTQSLMPHRELQDSGAARAGTTVLLPGPRWLWVLSNHPPFLYSASTCPSRNNVTPCYCSSMSQSGAIHDTERLVWENIIVILEQNGKRGLAGNRGSHCLSLSRSPAPLLFPPPGPPSSLSEGSMAKWRKGDSSLVYDSCKLD